MFPISPEASLAPRYKGAVDDHAGANAGPKGDKDHVLNILTGAKPQLAEGGQVNIIIHGDGEVVTFEKPGFEWKLVPMKSVSPCDNTFFMQGDAGDAHTDTAKAPAFHLGAGKQFVDQDWSSS